jgi:hypothetical protein
MKVIGSMIVAENNLVDSMHQKALRQSQTDDDAIDAIASVSSLEEDLQDA